MARLLESKEDMWLGRERQEEFTKRKRDERRPCMKESYKKQVAEKTRNIAPQFSGKCIRNGFLKKETEGMLFATQQQALRTNSIKAKMIDKQPVSPKCRLCGTKEETVMHLINGCPKWTQKQYKRSVLTKVWNHLKPPETT